MHNPITMEAFAFSQLVLYRALDENVYPAVCLGHHRDPREGDYSIAVQYPDRVVITSCWAERLSAITRDSTSAYDLLKEHGVLITCFSFDNGGKVAYRFYFTNIKDRYIYNPMVEGQSGKKSFSFYYDYDEGMRDMISAAKEYIHKKFASTNDQQSTVDKTAVTNRRTRS